MANTIITKNSITASAVPTSGQLVQGELAVNVTDKRLFTENSAGTVVEVGVNPSSITTGNLTASGIVTLPDNAISGDKVEGGTINAVTINTLTSGTVDINGGAVDGTTVGATTAAAGAFTTLTVSSAVSEAGSLTSTNAANSLVRRDAGGGFSAGIISAARFDGPLNGTLGVAAANTIKATTITASGIITSTIASGSGENFSTAGQATLSIAQSGNALLLSGSGYYLVSISEVLQTGNSGVYVIGNGSVIFLGGIGFVATTTTPTNGQISVAYSGGNYRVYIGHTAVATYGIKATIIRQH